MLHVFVFSAGLLYVGSGYKLWPLGKHVEYATQTEPTGARILKRFFGKMIRRKTGEVVTPLVAGPKGIVLSDEELQQFHRPQALRYFAFGNLIVAVFYSVLGTTGIISIMFFDGALTERVTFSNMIELLQRSLLHSMGAGVALIVDHLMQGTGEILKSRRVKRLPPSTPPPNPVEPAP